MHWIYLIHELNNLSWITEINELFHDILIYWDAPVHHSHTQTGTERGWRTQIALRTHRNLCQRCPATFINSLDTGSLHYILQQRGGKIAVFEVNTASLFVERGTVKLLCGGNRFASGGSWHPHCAFKSFNAQLAVHYPLLELVEKDHR